MTLFKRTEEKANSEALKIVMKENARLKRENQNLRNELDSVMNLKETYTELIEQIHNMKIEYLNKLKEFDILKEKYTKELDKITNRK